VQTKSLERLAFAALLTGASAIGFAPIFVRLSEVGPVATAFYRLLLAWPVLWVWMAAGEERSVAGTGSRESVPPRRRRLWAARRGFLIAGACFAGDMALWNWSLKLTTVANSTLLTNFTPFFVMLGARVLFAERITPWLLGGLALALAGGALLVGTSLGFAVERVWGDLLALFTAVFYAGYLLAVKQLRRTFSTATILTCSGVVTCVLLFVVALVGRESFLAQTARGWMMLVLLALVGHVGGQGLIAYALAHLPAGFSAVSLLLQPVVAAVLAWLLLGEPLRRPQILGGLLILGGIGLASRGRV
jgi:drug/metabolite transporter (DMT)-like permease